MAYTLIVTKRAKKDIRKINPQDSKRVEKAIDDMAKLLPTRPSNWTTMGPNTPPAVEYGANGKITVGKYRVLTTVDDAAHRLTIPRVFKRGDAAYGFSEAEEAEGDTVYYLLVGNKGPRITDQPDWTWDKTEEVRMKTTDLEAAKKRLQNYVDNWEEYKGQFITGKTADSGPSRREAPKTTYYIVVDDEGPWLMDTEPGPEDGEVVYSTNNQADAEAALSREAENWDDDDLEENQEEFEFSKPVFKTGDRVYYKDIDSDVSSGWGEVIHVQGEDEPEWEPEDFDDAVVTLYMDDGSNVEAFPHELTHERDAAKAGIVRRTSTKDRRDVAEKRQDGPVDTRNVMRRIIRGTTD